MLAGLMRRQAIKEGWSLRVAGIHWPLREGQITSLVHRPGRARRADDIGGCSIENGLRRREARMQLQIRRLNWHMWESRDLPGP